MASLQDLGQLFMSFDALKDSIEDWSVWDKFYSTVTAKNTFRVIYKCKTMHATGDLEQNRPMIASKSMY